MDDELEGENPMECERKLHEVFFWHQTQNRKYSVGVGSVEVSIFFDLSRSSLQHLACDKLLAMSQCRMFQRRHVSDILYIFKVAVA